MRNLTKLSCTEAGSIVNNIIKISYRKGNIDIVWYREHFKGANPYCISLRPEDNPACINPMGTVTLRSPGKAIPHSVEK